MACLRPTVAHSVDGLDAIEGAVDDYELGSDALDLRGHRAVIENDVRGCHELLAVAHVAGMLCERVHDPKLRHRQRHGPVLPASAEAIDVKHERAALEKLGRGHVALERLDPTQKRGDSREQMLQSNALGQIVVGAETQTGDDVELALTRREKDDRELRRARSELAAEIEATLDFGA